MKLWPRSLFGQVMASVAIALLIAQAVSAILLFRAAEQRRDAAMLNSAAFQLISADRFPDRGRAGRRGEADDRRGARREQRERNRLERQARRAAEDTDSGLQEDGFRLRRLPSRLRLEESPTSPLLAGETSNSAGEAALLDILTGQGIEPSELQVFTRRAGDDPLLQEAASRLARFRTSSEWANQTLLVAAMKSPDGATWQIARVITPPRDARALPTMAAQTLILFAFLMLLLWFILRRITRPLAILTRRVDQFGQSHNAAEQIAPSGPSDIRDLMAAHNVMETRISGLLDEKDVMLGAIGHDLKTPLAALRVRIESVDDEAERGKMAASIEDITATLDDILSLARIGRPQSPPERAELSALTASVVEEFEDMGEPVILGDTARISAPVHITWVRRALRNLIGNAVRYGGNAEVTVMREGSDAVLQITDTGPGIPEDQIVNMLEAFTRGEASRNRATGGAGLGLTLARAIAEQHGGSLELTNRTDGETGLCARIRLPAG